MGDAAVDVAADHAPIITPDLAFKLAAGQAIFAFLEAERGEGWWGAKSMANYYEQQVGRR